MYLYVDSDADFLVLPKARSRGAGNFSAIKYLPPSKTTPKLNGAIFTECVTVHNVMTSAAEAKSQTMFHNGKATILIRITAEELDHSQPAITFKTENSRCDGILNATLRQK